MRPRRKEVCMKKLLAALLTLLLTLTACGGGGLTTFDAEDYLRGQINATYRGAFDEAWLEQVSLTEEEAQAAYEAGLDLEYQYFSAFFHFDETYITEETRQAVKDLLAELYQKSRCEILRVEKSGTGFSAQVKVQPVDLIALVSDTYMEAYAAEFSARYGETTLGDLETMPEADQADFWTAYENDWAMGIVELVRTHLSELGYREAVTMLLQFLPDEEGWFSIPETDFAHLDALILAYE